MEAYGTVSWEFCDLKLIIYSFPVCFLSIINRQNWCELPYRIENRHPRKCTAYDWHSVKSGSSLLPCLSPFSIIMWMKYLRPRNLVRKEAYLDDTSGSMVLCLAGVLVAVPHRDTKRHHRSRSLSLGSGRVRSCVTSPWRQITRIPRKLHKVKPCWREQPVTQSTSTAPSPRLH